MQGNHVHSSVLALGLLVALLASLPLDPHSPTTLAQGSEPEVKTGQAALAGDVSGTPLGTAFSYQGRLEKDGSPIVGTCNLRFKLWDALDSGSQVGVTLTRAGVVVSDGLFTVGDLDFGPRFSGDARWLEVAVQCSGDPDYTTLSPRQALTAVPAALSLALPFNAQRAYSGTLMAVTNSGTGDGLSVESAGGDGVYVASAGDHGVHVNWAYSDGMHLYWAADDGVYVRAAGNPSAMTPSDLHNGFEVEGAEGHGLYVGQADDDGLHVESAADDGLQVTSAEDGVYVQSAAGDGLAVFSAGHDGLNVYGAANDGVYVRKAGSPSTTTPSDLKNGFEIAGAEGFGLYVGRSNNDGLRVDSAGGDGLQVSSAAGKGMLVLSSVGSGLFVDSTGVDGLYVGAAGDDGVQVASAGDDGVHVDAAGSPSTTIPDPDEGNNGFEVEGAEGHGLYVGRADADGLNVWSAGGSGVTVGLTDYDGVAVYGAGTDGVYVFRADVDGVYVEEAAEYGVYANTEKANHHWGFYTPDAIYAGSALATGGSSMLVAQNGDGAPLETGDVVVVCGAGAPFAGGDFPAPLVRRAGPGGAAVAGVVYARFVAEEKVEEVQRHGQMERRTSLRSHSTEGPAAPGEYLLLVVLGPAQVKADTLAGGILPGDLLAVAGEAQAALMAGSYTPGALVGTAMEALDAAQNSGLIWALVNPR